MGTFRKHGAGMEGERVKSKHLFNFPLAGVVDDDILEREREWVEQMGDKSMEEMNSEMDAMPDEDFAVMLQGMMESEMTFEMTKADAAEEAKQKEALNSQHVPTTHDGDYDVTVLVHTPKSLAGEESRACIIYAHGGGCVAGSAAMYAPYLSYMAVDCGVVVFNVDYRLAPGTRCPNNVLDYYEVVKYVAQNSADLGVDPARIAISGESGGGYICAGTMVQLARNDEAHLVKLAVPIIPMLSDYAFSDITAMTREEAENAAGQQKVWRLLAGKKMAPTIIWEAEFDFYITEAFRFANRLRAAGRLLEFVVIPGSKHGSGMSPMHKCFTIERDAWRTAIEEYLLK